MLKTNTVLTAVCAMFGALLCWLGKGIWDDVAAIKSATTATAAQVQTMSKQLDDHELRIRQTEHEVTILQQVQREDRSLRAPKMLDTKP